MKGWISYAGCLAVVICAVVFYALPARQPQPPPQAPPIDLVEPEPAAPPVLTEAETTEAETIVELHRALPHAKPAPQIAIQTTDDYLCEVYQRTPVKRDGSGDFTWKDPAAAKRKGIEVCAYVIGGLNPQMKERLVSFGRQADAKGLQWSMFSGFRDDYRQSIASGLKARTGNSQHGGSRVTRGYGDGRAIDIAALGPIKPVLALIDSIGRELGLTRPMKRADPNHVQLAGKTAAPVKRMARAKVKVRYAKRLKHHRHRTRIATRPHDADYSRYFHTDHGYGRPCRCQVPVSRRT